MIPRCLDLSSASRVCAGQLRVLGRDLQRSRTTLLLLRLDTLADVDTASLQPSELQRHGQAQHRGWQDQFLKSRFALRQILGGFLRLAPEELDLQQSPGGPPRLSASHHCKLNFSLSHSGTLLGVALHPGFRALGVDVQEVPQKANLRLAARYFPAQEVSWLRGLPATEQALGFALLWSARESLVKALQMSFPRVCRSLELLPETLPALCPQPLAWCSDEIRATCPTLNIHQARHPRPASCWALSEFEPETEGVHP